MLLTRRKLVEFLFSIMAHACIVKNCKNNGTRRLPNNLSRKLQWIKALQNNTKPGHTICNNTRLCSDHFQPKDFGISPTNLKRKQPKLTKDAVPSIFVQNQAPLEVFQLENNKIEIASSHTEPGNFDIEKAQKTYTRVLPIKFVTMPTTTPTCNASEGTLLQSHNSDDPLQIIKQEIESEDKGTTEDCFEAINPIDYCQQEIQIANEIEPRLKSVQTQTEDMTYRFSVYKSKDDKEAEHFLTNLETLKQMMLVFPTLGTTELI